MAQNNNNNDLNSLLHGRNQNDATFKSSVESLDADIKILSKDLKSFIESLKTMNQGNGSAKLHDDAQEVKHGYDRLRNSKRGLGSVVDEKEQKSLSDAFLEGLYQPVFEFEDIFRNGMKQAATTFVNETNLSMSDVSYAFGRDFSNAILGNTKNITKRFNQSFSDWQNAFNSSIKDQLNATVKGPARSSGSNAFSTMIDMTRGEQIKSQFQSGDFKGAVKNIKSLGQTAIQAAGGTGELIKNFAALGLKSIAASAAMASFQYILGQAGDVVEGFQQIFSAIGKAATRDQQSRSRNLELAQKRLQEDVETLVKKPFEILEQAAQAWYDAWDSNLRTINQTQGYTKADLQDLMANYSERVRSEGLSGEISSADIISNLTKVLQGGLTGKAAEEFAYQATKLNAAIPTQDFFSYSSSYASIIANAEKSGQSAAESLQTADDVLTSFASGILEAQRATGGLTTTLNDASSLFSEATKIAQAARTYTASDISNISSTLLAIQSEVGAVAPDLASSLTEKIYSIMTGGNSSDLVALRSLAGVNASNTDFLQAFVKNPQKILSTMFKTLGDIFSQSSDAYMEKAEGYSSLFGISSEAFQRVDFQELARVISSMNASAASLDENINLLQSGQTTTNEDILKNQQINQYMIDNGLSLVLDNEAGRAIQQHMWDEQIAREEMEATYGVELAGESKAGLLKILNSVNNILNFLNPLAWGKKIANAIRTANDETALKKDIKQVLQLGAVGSYNSRDLANLTSYNQSLNLTRSLVELMGGTANYGYGLGYARSSFGNGLYGIYESVKSISTSVKNFAQTQTSIADTLSSTSRNIESSYGWRSISKSQGYLANQYLKLSSAQSSNLAPLNVTTATGTAASATLTKVSGALATMLSDDYINTYVKNGTGYQGWAASASQNGIENLDEALTSAGYDPTSIETAFTDRETQLGVAAQHDRQLAEEQFWQAGQQFWQKDFPDSWQDPALTKMDTQIENLQNIFKQQQAWQTFYEKQWLKTQWPAFVTANGNSGLFNRFFIDFYKEFITHENYTHTTGYTYKDVTRIQDTAKKYEHGDVVNALAEMLTKNILDLKNPEVQTNALLAEILIVVHAIENQNNKVAGTEGTSKLLESLQSMALGMTATT